MPKKPKVKPIEEAMGVALAGFALSVHTLRFFQKNGTIIPADVNAILSGVLASLEQSDLVSEPAAHAARVVLSGVASDLGVPLRAPN